MDDEHRQRPDELAAQYASGGAVSAAQRWLSLVLESKDLRQAWPLTEPDLRVTAARAWVKANARHLLVAAFEPTDLIAALSEPHPSHPLWGGFADTQLREFAERWANIDLARWGWASFPRPISPDVELAVLADAGGHALMEADTLLPGLGFIMHHVPGEGWLVAGFHSDVGPQ